MFAAEIRRRRVHHMRAFKRWQRHPDEMNGEMVHLWRAIDQVGEFLESYVTKKRDKSAALAFMNNALKRHGTTEVIVTDGLSSCKATTRELGHQAKQETGR